MQNTQKHPKSREQKTGTDRIVDLWHTVELLIGSAMLVLATGTLIILLNWPTRISGMNYLLIIIPYLSLTGALVTAQFIRQRIQRKEFT